MKSVKYLLFLVCSLCNLWLGAQTPKWADKARRAVFSIVTYDKDNNIMNTGNGFFVSEQGVALSDYTLFKGAHRAVVMTAEGKQMPVAAIMGADDMYDVIKFKVDITSKKVASLSLATNPAAKGNKLWLLPYSTQKVHSLTTGQVTKADKVADYTYYTLDLPLKEKMVSCPLLNEEGLVVGLSQKATGQDTATICYAVDAHLVMNLSISALSYGDMTLTEIGIKKTLPENEEQAVTLLYLATGQLESSRYTALLNDFIEQYPENADGYIHRANHQLTLSKDDESMQKVEADFEKAINCSANKDDAYYNLAKTRYAYYVDKNGEGLYGDWNLETALKDIQKAITIANLPVYYQLEGDINYLKSDFKAALVSYEKVNQSNLCSPATLFTTAKTKEMMKAPVEEILALMDSCVAKFTPPYTQDAVPYLLERARVLMNANKARQAMIDYDLCFKALNGVVNDNFYYLREQACLKARQYQRALDDLAKAIEINPKELLYYAELCAVNLRVGRNEEAAEAIQKAIDINPSYEEGYRLLGVAQIQMKKNKEACASFSKAKELGDPNVEPLIKKYCK